MIVLLGESGSGKSTLERMLCDKYNLKRIVSYTTRPIRPGEMSGIDYHFISEDEFQNKLYDDKFAEHYVAENGWKYGVIKEDCLDNKICVVTPIGLVQLKQIKNLNITSIYVKSSKEVRKERLWRRGDNHFEMLRRFKTDEEEFNNIDKLADYTVDNKGTIDEAFKTLAKLLKTLEVIQDGNIS